MGGRDLRGRVVPRVTERPSSRLFYYGTDDEVRLGDRIRIRRWFRRSLEGVVCYIPGESPRHPEMESAYWGATWAIQLPDGSLRVLAYLPDQIQPRRKFRLVARGASYVPLDPGEQLEEELDGTTESDGGDGPN